MKIIALNASPRKNKTSAYLLDQCLDQLQQENPELEPVRIDLAGKDIQGCNACGACAKKLDCPLQDDFNPMIPVLRDPEIRGIIVATPVYMGSMTSQCKAFLDRTVMFRRNGFMFKNKIGGVIVVGGSRNGGQELTIQGVHAAFLIHGMIVAGDTNPTAHFGGIAYSRDGIENDQTGTETVRNLGKRIAELAGALTV